MVDFIRTLAIIIGSIGAGAAWAIPLQVPSPLVSTEWLARHLNAVVIIDLRKDTRSFTAVSAPLPQIRVGGKPVNPKIAVSGHIPGARLIDYRRIRGKRDIDGRTVDKMNLAKAGFEAVIRGAGVNDGSAVVIATKGLDTADLTMGTRLYWQLKYFGHDNVAILDGGTVRWLKEGRPVTAEASEHAAGDWTARAERAELLATSDDVEAARRRGTLLVDSRPLSQYLGTAKRDYVYASGHIPGARPFPSDLMTGQGAAAGFLSADQYRELGTALGLDLSSAAITYCNSGHLASGTWFIMSELLGNKDVRLYDGSLHQWTLEKRPVTGIAAVELDDASPAVRPCRSARPPRLSGLHCAS